MFFILVDVADKKNRTLEKDCHGFGQGGVKCSRLWKGSPSFGYLFSMKRFYKLCFSCVCSDRSQAVSQTTAAQNEVCFPFLSCCILYDSLSLPPSSLEKSSLRNENLYSNGVNGVNGTGHRSKVSRVTHV